MSRAGDESGSTPIEPEALPGGLRLRSATLGDVEQIADLSAVHHVHEGDPPDEDIRVFVREAMARPGPQASVADWLLIDDPATGEIAAKLLMLSHRWDFEGVPLRVGRVEYVTTAPAHRGRGLMTVLMDRYHAVSRARGQAVQVISGISNYYRRFGYEYALPKAPYRELRRGHLPPAGPDTGLRFRRATTADVPLLLELTRTGNRRWGVSGDVGAEDWRHELEGMTEANAWRPIVTVVEEADGCPVGAASSLGRLVQSSLTSEWCELAEGASWERIAPPLLRHLDAVGTELHERDAYFHNGPPERVFTRHALAMGDEHPLVGLLGGRLTPLRTRPALYVRVADVPAFLRTIAPALERRLAASPVHAGHAGELRLSFYGEGVTLRFEEGRLVGVEAWSGVRTSGNDALFPDLVFLQLLFGHRSMAELEHAFPDCRALSDDALSLLGTLFPKRPSWVWPFF